MLGIIKMECFFKSVITFGLLLSFSLQDYARDQNKFSCRVQGMAGEQPNIACYVVRDFLKIAKKTPSRINGTINNGDYNAHIFYGKSNTGKSMAATQIASEAGAQLNFYAAKDLAQKVQQTNNIPALFTNIYENAEKLGNKNNPVMIVFDDLDELIKNQDESTISEIFDSLSTQIDKHRGSYIITIYTCKKFKWFDHPFLTRCTKSEWILPNTNKRKEISMELAQKHQFQLSAKKAHGLALVTPGFSIRDLDTIIKDAAEKKQRGNSFSLWHGYWMAMKNNSQLFKDYISNSLLFLGSTTLMYLYYKYGKRESNQYHIQKKEDSHKALFANQKK